MYTLSELKEYEEMYGSPLYIFDEDAFIENYLNFQNEFQSRYEKYRVAFSYKTNYTPYICSLIKKMDGYAEVVSDMEYYLAKKIGYDNSQIVYNGPMKGELSREHLLNGGIYNVDSLDELAQIIQFVNNYPEKQFEVGIRVNINIGQSFVSRFGIDVDNGDFEKAVQEINKVSNLSLVGLHCHVGQSRTIEAWENRVKVMLDLADEIFEKVPKYLDLGSGMYGKMDHELAIQFSSNIPQFKEYAQATATAVEQHYKNIPLEEKPYLFTEPGTTIINKYVDFMTKVVSLKHIKEKTFAVTDASKHNIGEICTLKKLPMVVIESEGKSSKEEDVEVVGYTCLEHDVMYAGYSGPIKPEDYIVFANVGGYSNVSKPPFILPNCAMIAISKENKTIKLIKRKETFDDVFQTYVYEEM